jgi:hypothetical protein
MRRPGAAAGYFLFYGVLFGGIYSVIAYVNSWAGFEGSDRACREFETGTQELRLEYRFFPAGPVCSGASGEFSLLGGPVTFALNTLFVVSLLLIVIGLACVVSALGRWLLSDD